MALKQGAALAAQIDELEVPAGMLALWSLGQSGFVVKAGDTVALLDPYLSDSVAQQGGPSRLFPPPINPDQLTMIDLILCTHEHPDHTDPATLLPVLTASPQARLVVSRQSLDLLHEAGLDRARMQAPPIGARHTVGQISYTAIPAAHEKIEIDEQGRARWMGFVLEYEGITLLHTGDSIPADEQLAALKGRTIDVAMVPINGRDYFREATGLVGNYLPREASQFADEIGAEVVVPMHNDLFATNRLNPAELWDDLDRRYPRQRCHQLQPGELYLYVA